MVSLDKLYDLNTNSFPRENQDGNIEYKWRLDTKTNLGINKLVSQLLWRLSEGKEITGNYEAYYIIGILDDGRIGELSIDDLEKSIKIFKTVVEKANLDIVSEEHKQYNTSNVYMAYVKRKTQNKFIEEMNIIFVGGSQSGKTSTIANLCYDMIDNAKGLARNLIFKHEYEKKTGITTSIKKEIIGINSKLNSTPTIINYTTFGGWDEITTNSDVIINLYDFPGNEQYYKTILCGLLTHQPDHVFIFYNDDISTIKFYIDYCTAFGYQFTVLSNNSVSESTIKFSNLHHNGIDKIKDIILNLKYSSKPNSFISDIFRINDIYNIPERGIIITGLQINGTLSMSNKYKLLDSFGLCYDDLKIKSIHKKNIESNKIDKLESGSLNIILDNKKLTKNMILINNDEIKLNNKFIVKFNIKYCEKIDTYNKKILDESFFDYSRNHFKNTYAILNSEKLRKWQKNGDRFEITIYNGNFIINTLAKITKITDNYQFECVDNIVLQDTNILIQIKNFSKTLYDLDDMIFGTIQI
jgi:GTPase